MSSPSTRTEAGGLGRPVGFLDQTEVGCVYELRDLDASRPGVVRRERVSDGTDVLRRGVALGPDERQTVLKLAQGPSRRRIQQAVDRRPILEERLRAQQVRDREAHVGHARHEVLETVRFRDAPRRHSREPDQIRGHRVQRVQRRHAPSPRHFREAARGTAVPTDVDPSSPRPGARATLPRLRRLRRTVRRAA